MAEAYPLMIGPGAGWGWSGSNPTFSAHALDATNDASAWVFQAPSALTITHLGFRYNLRTGTPPTYRISLQSVSVSTGNPDGTVLGGGSPASGTFTPPASSAWNSLWQWIALDNSYTCARGEILAVVLDYSAGTINGTNNSSVSYVTNAVGAQAMGLPYANLQTAGTWAKSTATFPVFGVRTSTQRLGCIMQGSSPWTVSTTGRREAMRFQVPSGWGATFTLAGVRASLALPPAGSTFKLGLWEGDMLLQDASFDVDVIGRQNAGGTCDLYFDESSLSTLNCGTTYRVGVECEGNAAIGFRVLEFGAYEDSEMWRMRIDAYRENYDGSTWVQNSTQVPQCALILEDFTEPSAGGLLLHPGLVGGLRG